MERFRTVVSPVESPSKMAISDRILTIGSCFSDAIGQRMSQNKFQSLSNPFGIIYNPLSIHKVATYALDNNSPPPATFVERGEIVLNYDFHSELSALTEVDLQSKIISTIDTVGDFIPKAKWLIITYGTAWVYVRKDNGEVVANCHKIAQSYFDKSLLKESVIVESFGKFYGALKAANPKINVIVTVSPVRHIKDTLSLNSVSKGILRTACYEISERFKDASYFPAFEIMVDDLRDYRFYKADMIHPNEVAEDYIWDKFISCYGDQQLISFLAQWREIQNAIHHKPFHEETTAHQLFLKETIRKLQAVSSLVNVDVEIDSINKRILKNFR
ncbi:MAG: GSCFA domain-containing protein [Chryseolinea sp.]